MSVPGAALTIIGAAAIGAIEGLVGGYTSALDGFISVAAFVGPALAAALLYLAGTMGGRLAGGFILGVGGLLASLELSFVARLALAGSLGDFDWRLPAAAVVMLAGGLMIVGKDRQSRIA